MRKQIAFAPLTEAEIDQIADWLRNQTYEIVRERVRKPRSEGGFGLNISRSPLERLHEKTNKVARINAHIASGEKLTLAKFDAINAGETSASEKVHDAIMSATYDLATSGQNTPAQLLSLQHLADFPARAEIREQRLELDLQKHTLRIEMAEHRKHLGNEYLALAKRRVQIAENKTPKSKENNPDTLLPPGFLPRSERTWSDLSERARLHWRVSKEDWARRMAIGDRYDENGNLKETQEATSAPQSLSETTSDLDSQGENQLKESKIEAGSGTQTSSETLISPSPATDHLITDHLITDPTASVPGPEDYHHGSRSDDLLQGNTLVAGIGGQSSIIHNQSSSDSAIATSSENSAICDLQSKVDAYSVRRAHEYWDWYTKVEKLPNGDPAQEYLTEFRHCPCGNPCPCPNHEIGERHRPFEDSFWTVSPHSSIYMLALGNRDLPYRNPTECVPKQFR